MCNCFLFISSGGHELKLDTGYPGPISCVKNVLNRSSEVDTV